LAINFGSSDINKHFFVWAKENRYGGWGGEKIFLIGLMYKLGIEAETFVTS